MKFKLILIGILATVVTTSCFQERRLKKEFDWNNNKKLVKVSLFENNIFRQEIQITTLFPKETTRKTKRKYDVKLKDKELVRDTFVNIGFWKKSNDTVLLHGIAEFNNERENNLKIFDVEIFEQYDTNLVETKFEIKNKNEFNLIRISINNLNPFRSSFSKSDSVIYYSDAIKEFNVMRHDGVKQVFKKYVPTHSNSNHFVVKVTEVKDSMFWMDLETLWTKHLLVTNGEVIPGRYYSSAVCGGTQKRKPIFRGFDEAQKIKTND